MMTCRGRVREELATPIMPTAEPTIEESTATPSATPQPTATAMPTATSRPTDTSVPTARPLTEGERVLALLPRDHMQEPLDAGGYVGDAPQQCAEFLKRLEVVILAGEGKSMEACC